ncbi:oligopeptide ABC transporter, periplasmatic component [Candidatus Phytoplasma pruni]|uniref:Oligopeptide ABC transporter, periplasmatic component n=2 Tax=Candidatus Phytoplasma pruni TaxID=479893 RepID=A0A0M1N0C5_9MOLU|nr:oligopeptide ABC transporter, periplasmatic component [Candidatus Phytoplasma pruni]
MMNSLDGTVNDLGCYLKSSFFVTDIDWNKAIKEGYATYPGDFSQHRKEKHKPGECVPGDENKISTKVLKPMTLPGIIKKLPEHAQLKDANNRNLEGNEYSERSKKVFENSYTFTLKEGLTFENGEPIDASTVEYTLKQYIDPKQKNARAENVFKAEGMDLKDAKGYYEGQITNFNQVTGFKKVENDPYSFTLTYNSEKALYNAMGALDSITLVPPRYYEESFENKAERKNNVYGTPKKPIQSYGPYVIKEWSPNQKYVFNKNYNYWNKNKHHNKAISWTIVDKKDIQHSMFKDGKVNTFGLDSNYYSSYSKDPTYKEFPVDNKTSLSINVLDRKDEFKNAKTTAASSILKDLDFRKALFYAIDRQDFVNQVDILSNPSFSFVPDVACVYFDEPFEIPYNSSANHKENQKILTDQMDTYGFDPAKAKTSFDRAYDKWKVNNQKDPKLEMEFIYSNTSEETDKKARYLKNVFENTFGSDKINIKLSSITRETYLRKLQADKYDYELVFSPVQGCNITGYYFNSLGADKKWCHETMGIESLSEHKISIDLTKMTQELEQDKPVWYNDFVNGFNQEEKEEGKPTNNIPIPGLTKENGKHLWKGTITEFMHYWNKTLMNPGKYASSKEETIFNIVQTLERVFLENLPAIPISVAKGAYVSKNLKNLWPNYDVLWGWGDSSYEFLTSDSDYQDL